jgi:hypothetical protein
MQATSESKDNIRRGAASLQGFANVIVDPGDKRARKLVLTRRGRKRTRLVFARFEKELLRTLGAREVFSQRAEDFKQLLWDATAYLAPENTADQKAILRWKENRDLVPDDSLRYVQDDSESVSTRDDPPEDWIPW